MAYGDYALQVFNFIPVGYWKINSSTLESPLFGKLSAKTLVKADTSSTYRPLTFSSNSGGTILNASTSTITLADLNDYGIASTVNKYQKFTINFWYQNLNESSGYRFLTIGTNIKLNAEKGRIVLDFMGQISIAEISDYRDLLNITISYDGNNSLLSVNGVDAQKYGVINYALFEASPDLVFLSASSVSYQVSDLSIYSYNLSPQNINFLYDIGSFESTEILAVQSSLQGLSFYQGMSESDMTLNYSPADVNLRNCVLQDSTFKLKDKPPATINTGATYNLANTGYAFTSAGSIKFYPDPSDVDLSDTRITVTAKTFSSRSGTIANFKLANNFAYYVKAESGNLKLYGTDSATAKATVAISTPTSFYLDIVDNNLTFVYNSTSVSIGSISSKIYEVTLGNSAAGNSAFDGYLQSFSINYKEYPLQTGKYFLDMTVSSSNYISPIQDGVATFIALAPTNIANNYVQFQSNSNNVTIRAYQGLATSTAQSYLTNYYACSGTVDGTNIISLSKDSSVLSSVPTSITPVFFSVRLLDSAVGYIYSSDKPALKDFKYVGYVSNRVRCGRPIVFSSATFNSILPANTESINTLAYNSGFKVNTSGSISLNNNSENIFASTRSVYFNLKITSIPTTGVVFSIGGATITLTNNTSSYTLKATGTATGIYVNNTYTANATASASLIPYQTNSIILVVPSTSYTSSSFAGLQGAEISLLGYTNYDLSLSSFNTHRARLTNSLFNENSTDVADTSTITMSETSFSVRAFTPNIIYS